MNIHILAQATKINIADVWQIIKVSLVLLWLVIISFGIGQIIMKWLKMDDRDGAHTVGTSVLIGIGTLGYIILLLGIGKWITKEDVIASLLLITLLLIKVVLAQGKIVITNLVNYIKYVVKHPFLAFLLLLILMLVFTNYIGSYAPPIANDEIAYHLPEAQLILSKAYVPFNLGGHFFYGNLPVLMEVIYALGIMLGGYGLVHAIHFTILICLCLVVGGMLTKKYKLSTGLLGVLLILLIYDLTWNATTGYIDAAAVSFEIGSLLFAAYWLDMGKSSHLKVSAILLGLATSIKYSTIATAGFICLMLLTGLIINRYKRRSAVQDILWFGTFVITFGGYWYIKNAILHGNPFYPLYFGHRGISNPDYQGLLDAIQQFTVPRTIANFLTVPNRLYLSVVSISTFFSFYIALLAFFIRKNGKFHTAIVVYFLTYLSYWFFAATHQTRFLLPALITSAIVSSIVLTYSNKKIISALLLLIAATIFYINHNVKPLVSRVQLDSYWQNQTKYNAFNAALGRESRSQFISRYTGCGIEVMDYLNGRNMAGNVLDNWTVWHDPNIAFYAQKNRFLTLDVAENKTALVNALHADGISYIYFNINTKKRFFEDRDPWVIKYKTNRDAQEELLLKHSKLIYKVDDCQLYQIDFNKISPN